MKMRRDKFGPEPQRRAFLLGLTALPFFPTFASAQDRFDGAALPARDIRILQASLALSDHYNGLMDGDWGPRTGTAFDAWRQSIGGERPATPDDAAALAIMFVLDDQEAGWTQEYLTEVNFTYALPRALLAADPARSEEARLVTPLADLTIDVTVDRDGSLDALHEDVTARHNPGDAPYSLRRNSLRVSTAEQFDNRLIYLRSIKKDDFWVSLQVEADPDQHARLRVIASSMRTGRAPPLSLTPGGNLNRRVKALGF